MKRGLTVWECASCLLTVFPRRLGCPRCGSAEWQQRAAETGVVEEATLLRRVPGRALQTPISIGSVRLDAGPLVIARLEAVARSGTQVELHEDGGVPVAVAASATQG